MTLAVGEDQAVPSLKRRLACLIYDALLALGIVMATGLSYGLITQQRHALVGSRGLQLVVFIALGLYFVGFWVRQGQTLAMRTWHIRLVGAGGQSLSTARAVARYLLCWMWVLPALLAAHIAGLSTGWPVFAALLTGVLVYAGLSQLNRSKQYWHDIVCGTRLVDTRLL